MSNNRSFHIQTFGCQMNEHDSEIMAGMLEELGYERIDDRNAAGVAIINTCSVREHADERFFGTLGQLKKIKKSRNDFTVCVCGCMMQQQHIIDRIKEKFPWVDVIFGTHNIHKLPELLTKVSEENERQIDVWPGGKEIAEDLPSDRLFKHKAFVNIMYGCNNFCTYCIVPYTRGRERSRDPLAILKEIRGLVADGVKEVTLLGQNVNSYCGVSGSANDVSEGECMNFSQLLREIAAIDGLERIRFMTSHPKDLSDELIEVFRTEEKVCPHIHLPVQSGSDRVLKRMNRHYDKERYFSLVDRIRKARPGIAITTDIIVGFPGETEEDFEDTLELCRRVKYDAAFTFIYSVRKGTPAAEYEDQIPEEVKHERFTRLVDVINEGSAERNHAYQGKKVHLLVDGPAKNENGVLQGRTGSFKQVTFDGEGRDLTGQFVDVEITEAKTFSLAGKLCDK